MTNSSHGEPGLAVFRGRSQSVSLRAGLTLTLNIDQDDYVDAAGDIAGARILVLPQGRMPFPEDQGITVAPGRVTYLGVQQVKR